MFDFTKLADPTYLFSINTIMLTRSDRLFFVAGLACLVIAIALKIASLYAPTPVDAAVRNKFFIIFLSLGLAEIVWFGARYEHVGFFGSHFIAILLALGGLVWGILELIKTMKRYGPAKREWEKSQVKQKYLPQ